MYAFYWSGNLSHLRLLLLLLFLLLFLLLLLIIIIKATRPRSKKGLMK
jgi:hypothetical protein